jgi:transposase-like protein
MTESTDQTVAAGNGNEVVKRAGKRHFSVAYRIGIVEEANRCTKPGEVSALLRREGLYSSCLARFRKQYAAGVLTGGGPSKRKADRVEDEHLKRILDLERENRKLRRSLSQAEVMLDIQKKVSELMGISLPVGEDADWRK